MAMAKKASSWPTSKLLKGLRHPISKSLLLPNQLYLKQVTLSLWFSIFNSEESYKSIFLGPTFRVHFHPFWDEDCEKGRAPLQYSCSSHGQGSLKAIVHKLHRALTWLAYPVKPQHGTGESVFLISLLKFRRQVIGAHTLKNHCIRPSSILKSYAEVSNLLLFLKKWYLNVKGGVWEEIGNTLKVGTAQW